MAQKKTHLVNPIAAPVNREADAIGRAVEYTFAFDPKSNTRMMLIKAEMLSIEDTYALRREHKAEDKRKRLAQVG